MSFVICHFCIHPKFSAFGVIFITQAYFRQVGNLRPPNIRLGICVYYENGYSPRPNCTPTACVVRFYCIRKPGMRVRVGKPPPHSHTWLPYITPNGVRLAREILI